MTSPTLTPFRRTHPAFISRTKLDGLPMVIGARECGLVS